MFLFATQAFEDGLWTLAPEEPTSLSLAVVALGTVAIYTVLAGRSARRVAVSAKNLSHAKQSSRSHHHTRRRRAA